MFSRAKVAHLAAEFVGTGVLALAILSMAGRTSFPFFAAVAAGLTYAAMVLVFGSRLQFNPAVTISWWTVRAIPTMEAVAVIAVQMLGGAAAWQLSQYMLNQPLPNVGGAINWNVFVAQAVGAFVFALGLAAARRRHGDERYAAVAGLALMAGYMTASLTASSNGIINPAVALGMQSWGWAYTLGPVVGAIVAATVYPLVFVVPENKTRAARAKAAVKKTLKSAKKTVAKKR